MASRTGFLDFIASRVCDAPSDLFAQLTEAITPVIRMGPPFNWTYTGSFLNNEVATALEKAISTPVDCSAAWIQRNDTSSDVLVISLDGDSTTGLIAIKGHGIWLIAGFKHSWRKAQDRDLVVMLNEEEQLVLQPMN